jgi:hypothetical protein
MERKKSALFITAGLFAACGVFTAVMLFDKGTGTDTITPTQTPRAVAAASGSSAITPGAVIETKGSVRPDLPPTPTPYAMIIPSVKPVPVLITDSPGPDAELNPTVQPSAAPRVEMEIDGTEYFALAPGAVVPAGFIVPKVKLIYDNGIGYGSFWHFAIENLDEYEPEIPKYSFRVTCVNYDLLNRRQIIMANGTESPVLDFARWFPIDEVSFGQIKAGGAAYVLPLMYYASIADEATFRLLPGMKLEYRFEMTDGTNTVALQKAFLLNDVKF